MLWFAAAAEGRQGHLHLTQPLEVLGPSAYSHRSREHVDQDQAGQATDGRRVDVRVLEGSKDETDIGQVDQGARAAADPDHRRVPFLPLGCDVEDGFRAPGVRDGDEHAARPTHRRRHELLVEVHRRGAGDTEEHRLLERVLGDDPGRSQADEQDIARREQELHGRCHRGCVERPARAIQAAQGVVEDLHRDRLDRVVELDRRVRHRDADGEGLGKGELERLEAVKPQAGAEAHDRRLADSGRCSQRSDTEPHRSGSVLQNHLGDLALRRPQPDMRIGQLLHQRNVRRRRQHRAHPWLRTVTMLCTAWLVARLTLAVVYPPMCGVAIPRWWRSSGVRSGGSLSKASTAYAASVPSSSAVSTASSSTRADRAVLTSTVPRAVAASRSAPIRACPSDGGGQCRLTTCDVASRSSRPTRRTDASVMNGSCATTSAPNAVNTPATRSPTAPSPTTPTVHSASSEPCDLSHRPCRSAADVHKTCRSAHMVRARVSSATPWAFAPAARSTRTPARSAAAMSIESVPVPLRLITRSPVAARRTRSLIRSTPASQATHPGTRSRSSSSVGNRPGGPLTSSNPLCRNGSSSRTVSRPVSYTHLTLPPNR